MPAVRIRFTGIVQGVGFRPAVEEAARRAGVAGYVVNLGGAEVEAHVEASSWSSIAKFLSLLAECLPPPAKLSLVEVAEAKPRGYEGFSVAPSGDKLTARSMVPPDFSVCSDCLAEVTSSTRWRGYAFNSCAYCGPRFSVMLSTPYDRELTSNAPFTLCTECLADYRSGGLRRRHVQGISCPKCGPQLYLLDSRGRLVEAIDPLAEAAKLIDEGFIVAVKGIGGFHLAALASRDDVVEELRRRKRRPQKPFAVMALNSTIASKIVVVDEAGRSALESPEKPIVLLPRRSGARLSELVAPGLDTVGVMLPYTPLHHLLLSATSDKYLIMTSANVTGKPMCTTTRCVLEKLSNVVDYILTHPRLVAHRVDDSVVRFTRGRRVFLRRSRGYAPAWIRLPASAPEAVAVGAELQNVGGVSFEDKAVLTAYIGDTDDLDALEDLRRELEWLIRVYRLKPRIIVRDAHPAYNSRLVAEELAGRFGARLLEVQHHHAHLLSAAADYGDSADELRVGVAVDGVGWGLDGTIWGGEVLVFTRRGFERVGHLAEQPMPGGDAATRRPVRMLVGILSKFMDEDEVVEYLRRRGLLAGLRGGELEARIAYRQARSRQAPRTTSTGRLLDAVSALLSVCFERTYEGEPAMKLEAHGRRGRLLDVDVKIRGGVVDTTSLVEQLISLLDEGTSSVDVAYTAMWSVGYYLGVIASSWADRLGVSYVYLSGGAAVNEVLVAGFEEALGGLEVRLPRRVPPGDGGIALGQLLAATGAEE